MSPVKFIPLVEDSSPIIPIGIWVLQQSCFQLKKWNDSAKTAHLRISVNVSALQFAQQDFVNQVKIALEMSNCNPKLMLSLDDFGMRYSSLSVLKQLPLDELKIDQSFVSDVLERPDSALIIQTIISIGSNLGLDVIAEGVAEKDQKSFLKKVGCRAGLSVWKAYECQHL